MPDSRVPGPAGTIPASDDLSDGTLVRRLSSLKEPTGSASAREGWPRLEAAASTVQRMLAQLRNAADAVNLQEAAISLLGPYCFSAGVIAGIGLDVLNMSVDLLKLVRTLVLADLNDIRSEGMSWWHLATPVAGPRALVARLAGLVFDEEMRSAAKERDALMHELKEALSNPFETFELATASIVVGYQDKFQKAQAHLRSGTMSGQFQAGIVTGQLFVNIISLLAGVAGIARVSIKIATKLPRLVKLANEIKSIPRPQRIGMKSSSTVNRLSTPSQASQHAIRNSPSATEAVSFRTASSTNRAMILNGQKPAWMEGSMVENKIVPPGTKFQMVVSEGQAQALMKGKPAFGSWASAEPIPSQAFARERLSILEEFKPDVSYLATVETTAPQAVNSGLAGGLESYGGGGQQVEFLGNRNLKLVGQPQPLAAR